MNNALSNGQSITTSIPDWYEVHYLSVCSGKWNAEATSADINQSTSTCVRQKAGYTFSLAQTLGSNTAKLLPVNSSYGTLDTKTPLILLTIGIALAGVSLISLLYGVVVLIATSTPPLAVLRVGYLASIPTAILLTISSAKTTALADKMIGAKDISTGVTVHAWIGWTFYVSAWLGAGFMWAAVGFSIAGAFRIASALQAQQLNSLGACRHVRVDKARY
jgi:hypothetical protein